MKPNRHHLRLDDATQQALAELCRLTLQTKSALMRRYIQEGVKRDALSTLDFDIARVIQNRK